MAPLPTCPALKVKAAQKLRWAVLLVSDWPMASTSKNLRHYSAFPGNKLSQLSPFDIIPRQLAIEVAIASPAAKFRQYGFRCMYILLLVLRFYLCRLACRR